MQVYTATNVRLVFNLDETTQWQKYTGVLFHIEIVEFNTESRLVKLSGRRVLKDGSTSQKYVRDLVLWLPEEVGELLEGSGSEDIVQLYARDVD